jgi:hypothetical protein
MKKTIAILVIFLMLAPTIASIRFCFADEPLKCPTTDDVQISNSYLLLSVFDASGSISLSTVSGELLLYPADTSNLALKVDGVAQNSRSGLESYMTQAPTIMSSNSVYVEWIMGRITLGLTYKLVNENLEVTAVLTNHDSISHEAGIRFLLDTMLGPNDGAPLYAPDIGVKTYETDVLNPTFNYWKAYDFYPSPSLEAYCTLVTIPNRVVFGWWPAATGSLWDYSINPDQRFYTPGYTRTPESDSCVLMYFDPLQLNPSASRTVVFSYGLSLSIESWKYSIISALDTCQSYMYNILSSAIDNYANMMLEFNKLGVDHQITIFKESAEESVFGSSDWKSNLEMFQYILQIPENLKEISDYLPILESINPNTFTQVPAQIERAFVKPTNQYKWGWVSRDLKYSGAGLILSAVRIVLDYYEKTQMENVYDKMVSFNNQLASVYQSIMNAPLDLATIKTALYNSFGNDIGDQIKTSHDESIKFVSELTLPEGVDPNYCLGILRGINSELSQVFGLERNIAIVGDSKYLLPDMNAYKTTTQGLCNAITASETFALAADLVGDGLFLYSLVASPTGAGGAACMIASLLAKTTGIIAKTIALVKEQGLYTTMFQGSQALFQLSYSMPMIASQIHGLVTKNLGSVVQPQRGQFNSITARNEWNWWNFRYDTYFDIMAESLVPVTVDGFIVFHVRSLDQNLKLADMDAVTISIPAGTCLVKTLTSMIHFSFWGGNYEAIFELWLGPLRAAWKIVFYNVGLGGGIGTNGVMQGIVSAGESQSTSYDSTGNAQNSMVVLNYGGSEINLHTYDSFGRHLGVDYSTGVIDEEIPGAQYSGPLPSIEWAILPPGLYTLEVVCISAETAEEFVVTSADFPTTPGILDVSPKTIYDTAEAGTISNSTLIVSEIGHQAELSNVAFVLSNLVNPDGLELEPFAVPSSFSLQPSETRAVELQYSIPSGTHIGVFQGTVTVTAEHGGGTYEETIPMTLEIVSYIDNTPPTTTLAIGEPKYISDTTYVTPDTPLTLEATDTGSGVYSTGYRIYNAIYDSGWQTYTALFHLTSLADGTYTVQYNSTDNFGNVEIPHQINVTLFSWNYIYQDTYGRGTTLKINLAHKFFQFITPDKNYGIKKATYMRQCGRAIIIQHCDSELRLITVAVDTKLDFCYAMAWDKQTRKCYLLIDKAGIEK